MKKLTPSKDFITLKDYFDSKIKQDNNHNEYTSILKITDNSD